MRSFKTINGMFEVATLAIIALFFLFLFSLLESAIETYYIEIQSHDLRQIDILMENELRYYHDEFDEFIKTPDRTTGKNFLREFSDLYWVDAEKKITEVFISEPGSFVFPGFDTGSSSLGAFLATVKSKDIAMSPMTRSPEKDDLSIYLVARENSGWLVGRIGLTRWKENIKKIARSMDTIIIIATRDGYILSSSSPTLPFNVLPGITKGMILHYDNPYTYYRARSNALANDIVVLTSMGEVYNLVKRLRILAVSIMGIIIVIVTIKIVLQAVILVRPLSIFTQAISRWRGEGGVIPVRESFLKYREIAELYRAFEEKANLIADSFDEIKRNQKELHDTSENLRLSLREKETLLKELYHRTKNNMQMINSILGLQASYLDDEKITRVFKETANRISSISLVHQKLYQSHSLSRIDLKDYIEELARLLIGSYGLQGEKIRAEFDLESVQLNIDTAVPCGLVLNELITNSLKYGFPGERKGTIFISLKLLEDKQVEIVFKDDGVGLPENLDLHSSKTLGASIIVTIIESQLKGTVEFRGSDGFRCRICFKPDLYPERI